MPQNKWTISSVIFILLVKTHLLMAATPEQKELVSMAAGQFMDTVMTTRQVNISFYIESVLFGKENKKNITQFYEIPSREFSREVTAVLLENIIFEESKGFNVSKVSNEEILDAKKKFQVISAKSSLWKKLKVSDSELTTAIQKKLQAKKFIRFKVESSTVPITDDEARAYFEENRLKFGSLPFDNFKQNIRAFLGRRQIDKRLKDWFEVLQNKYRVRNFFSEVES